MKNRTLFLIVAASAAFVIVTSGLQTAQDKREKVQTDLLISQVRLYAGGKEPAKPTATPPHCTMHVTQRIQTDPKMPPRVLAVLGREWPDTIDMKPVNYLANNQ